MNETPKYVIAVFDFDGTLTRRDSFFDFLLFTFGYIKVLSHSISILRAVMLYIMRSWSAGSAKEDILKQFIAGMPKKNFAELCQIYTQSRLPHTLHPQALEKVMWHKMRGDQLIIASASPEDWISPWANINGFEKVIATKLEVKEEKMTGNFSNANCVGEEKKRRFLAEHPDRTAYTLFVYSDSIKDQPLLMLADKAYYRKF